jgi:hypothetical protein
LSSFLQNGPVTHNFASADRHPGQLFRNFLVVTNPLKRGKNDILYQ